MIKISVSISILFALIIFTAGCSASGSITDPDCSPEQVLSSAVYNDSVAILGEYELIISEDLSAELIPIRSIAIGESFLVNGKVVFISEPCRDCLRLKTIDIDDDSNVIVTFALDHPFAKGSEDDGPPSAINRCDLDIFDTSMLVHPQGTFAWTNYSIGKAYAGYCLNQDGYSDQLSSYIKNTSGLPYFLVVDDSDKTATTHDWNRFEMGTLEHEFDIELANQAHPWTMKLYLTMGYGASAKKFQRFEPKYYNPEFNKKSAWKVNVIPPEADAVPDETNTWVFDDITTTQPVTVEVYDWQQGATLATAEKFKDADADEVFLESNVSLVELEIPGMFTGSQDISEALSGTGMPGDPLVYTFDIANELNLEAGEYGGIVKVTDERTPSSQLPPDAGRDFLIHSDTGLDATFYKIVEYNTYQTFTATVVDAI